MEIVVSTEHDVENVVSLFHFHSYLLSCELSTSPVDVCVTGLPLPSKDHAVVMARFAHECRFQMKELTKELEIVLGPGTSDLALRVGMHS